MIIAIDPGINGGVAWSDCGYYHATPMPPTEGELGAKLRSLVCTPGAVAYVEKVTGYAGGQGAPGSAMFNFGEGYGWIRGVLYAWGVPCKDVLPQVWQKPLHLGTRSKCASRIEWKRKLQEEAQRRFPLEDVTLKTADALLILDWALAQAK